jgi:hypothetical protein
VDADGLPLFLFAQVESIALGPGVRFVSAHYLDRNASNHFGLI